MEETYVDLAALVVSSVVTGCGMIFNGIFLLAIIKVSRGRLLIP